MQWKENRRMEWILLPHPSSQIKGHLGGITCFAVMGFYMVQGLHVHYRCSIKKFQNSLSEWANLLFQITELWASHRTGM